MNRRGASPSRVRGSGHRGAGGLPGAAAVTDPQGRNRYFGAVRIKAKRFSCLKTQMISQLWTQSLHQQDRRRRTRAARKGLERGVFRHTRSPALPLHEGLRGQERDVGDVHVLVAGGGDAPGVDVDQN